jgi:hypothetical protein
MKIEFIKETKIDGSKFYFTKVDGKFIDGSLSFDNDKAKVIYNNIVAHKGKMNFEEVLESVMIGEDIVELERGNKIAVVG